MVESEVINKLIGQRIASLRKQRELSQQQLADAIEIGRTSVGNIEKGRHQTSIPILYRFAIFFNVKITSLLPSIEELKYPELSDITRLEKALTELDPFEKDLILRLKHR